MAIKPENQFISSIHKHLPRSVYRMKNNNPYVGGVPDVWYSGSAADMWIEYKYIPTIPKRTSVKVALSALQTQWLSERHGEGRNVAVIVGCPKGGVFMTDHEWSKDWSPTDFMSRILRREELSVLIAARVEKTHGHSINKEHIHDH